MRPDPNVEMFLADLRRRLYAGKRTYGDRSFARPLAELVEELRQEADDLVGWTFPLRVRLGELASLAAEIDRRVPKAARSRVLPARSPRGRRRPSSSKNDTG